MQDKESVLKTKDRIFGVCSAIAAFGLAYIVFIFRDLIPQYGGISFAQMIIAGLSGGGITGILMACGVNVMGKKSDSNT